MRTEVCADQQDASLSDGREGALEGVDAGDVSQQSEVEERLPQPSEAMNDRLSVALADGGKTWFEQRYRGRLEDEEAAAAWEGDDTPELGACVRPRMDLLVATCHGEDGDHRRDTLDKSDECGLLASALVESLCKRLQKDAA
ncbi:hypothetical protein [Microbacterium sp.]|uniref:hypothetical protein n=1 Tax=Microbacterium sp. TaxID=51671 RepID=UPI0027376C7C|nr:hypothetical protein [Microbacterium sp.]MDP3950532.1 hypothetical protein [Microbacterium sp.]